MNSIVLVNQCKLPISWATISLFKHPRPRVIACLRPVCPTIDEHLCYKITQRELSRGDDILFGLLRVHCGVLHHENCAKVAQKDPVFKSVVFATRLELQLCSVRNIGFKTFIISLDKLRESATFKWFVHKKPAQNILFRVYVEWTISDYPGVLCFVIYNIMWFFLDLACEFPLTEMLAE